MIWNFCSDSICRNSTDFSVSQLFAASGTHLVAKRDEKSTPNSLPGSLKKIYQIKVWIWREEGGLWQKRHTRNMLSKYRLEFKTEQKGVKGGVFPISAYIYTDGCRFWFPCPFIFLACTTQSGHVQTYSSLKAETAKPFNLAGGCIHQTASGSLSCNCRYVVMLICILCLFGDKRQTLYVCLSNIL